MEKLFDLRKVSYYAYATEPFAHDAEGYVHAGDLEPWETHAVYSDDDKAPAPEEGYRFVTADDDAYAVREAVIFTEVWQENALYSRWGYHHPSGGTADASAPSYEADVEVDGETEAIYLIQYSW